MSFNNDELTILEKFNFIIQPVAVKFYAKEPDTIKRLNEKAAFCEMLKKAQEGNAFYSDSGCHTCEAGPYVLGQAEVPEQFINGEFGAGLKVFQNELAASRIYNYIPRVKKHAVNYVAFSPVNKLNFSPDLLVITADTSQSEIILRAASYKTGKIWLSRSSPVMGCAWIFIYPYLTGEINYIITGLGHGMKRRKLFPEGMQIISIPVDLLPSILDSLQDMEWILPGYKPDGPEFIKNLLTKLGLN